MILVEFDYLVTKDKIEEGENFKDFLNPVVSCVEGAMMNFTQRRLVLCSILICSINVCMYVCMYGHHL